MMKQELNTTLLFLYPNMLVGGIENWLMSWIRIAVKNNIKIIWLQNGEGKIFLEWREFILENVKIYKYDSLISSNKLSLQFEKNEEVIALSFGAIDYVSLLSFKLFFSEIRINCFYVIPHFTMPYYYPEMYFKGVKKYVMKREIAKIFERWDKNNRILFFSQAHIDTMEKKYGFKIKNPKKKILKSYTKNIGFDEELAKKRSKREEFKIITCGRFEFPHKGYMLGLIKEYNNLKNQYPYLKLEIIGYGSGEPLIKEELSKCSPEAQKDITLVGIVAPDKLSFYFNEAHVNISVAGAVIEGAKSGLVSIPARHYCEHCEVYGYLPQSKELILSEKPGENVRKYIEDLIEMSPENYIRLCKNSYNTYVDEHENNNEKWLFLLPNDYSTGNDIRTDVAFFKKMCWYLKIRGKIIGELKKLKLLFIKK